MPRTVQETANGGEDSVEFSLKFKDGRLELKMKEPGSSQRHRLVWSTTAGGARTR